MPSKPLQNQPRLPSSFVLVKSQDGFSEYEHTGNGLRVLHHEIPGTGVISTNITYKVGARDEGVGETGLAHMLEHMLFKPTTFDQGRGTESAAMLFERETGAVLNANTWRDRTTYFFSYPKSHFTRALTIEAERMRGVVLTDAEFQPERTNVLSEFDMYNGDPYFALDVAMTNASFVSLPYGHETIGFREDIEAYTTEKLQSFYDCFYWPNNATMIVIGDLSAEAALAEIDQVFGTIPRGPAITRAFPREPKQEGVRRVSVVRDSQTNILALGIRHDGFTTTNWLETMLLMSILTDGPDSILYPLLIETGKASRLEGSIQPSGDPNIATITITLSAKQRHADIEALVMKAIGKVTVADITPRLERVKSSIINREAFDRDTSLRIALDLTEYVSADAWPRYLETKKLLRKITPATAHARLMEQWNEQRMIIGQFIGTQS